MRRERRLDVEREADVGVDVHAFLRREGDRLVDGGAFVRRLRPHHVLHAGRKLDDLLGERIVEDPAGHHRDVLHAARASRELHPDADVPGVDAGQGDRRDDATPTPSNTAMRKRRAVRPAVPGSNGMGFRAKTDPLVGPNGEGERRWRDTWHTRRKAAAGPGC